MIDEQRDGSDAHDTWLQLLLGVVALAERVGVHLEPQAGAGGAGDDRAGDGGLDLDLLLGVVSLRRTLLAAMDRVATAAPVVTGSAPPPPHTSGGLLR